MFVLADLDLLNKMLEKRFQIHILPNGSFVHFCFTMVLYVNKNHLKLNKQIQVDIGFFLVRCGLFGRFRC